MGLSRRTYLRAAGLAVLAGLVGTAGCLDRGTPATPLPTVPAEPDYKGWFDGVNTYRGTADLRGQSHVTVKVGTQGANGYYYFDPVAVAVSPGTTLTWEWTGKGGTHNVLSVDGVFDSGGFVNAAGHTFSHTFDDPGVFKYVCTPHQHMGMKGVVFVSLGAAGSAA